jgi:hypothetical protein
MLYTDPVTETTPDDYTKIYRSPGSKEGHDPRAEAFHWGGLTAGSWQTAFWILLAPFALANVAGWMVWKRNRGTVVGIRLAGLALTALFSSQALTVAVPIHGWFHNQNLTGWPMRLATLGLFAACLSLVCWITGLLSTRSHFAKLGFWCRARLLVWPSRSWLQHPEVERDSDDERPVCKAASKADWTDPAIRARDDRAPWVQDERLWHPHSILHRIRRCHFATGLAIVSLGLARAMDLPRWAWWSVVAVLAGAVLLLIVTTMVPGWQPLQIATAWLTPIAFLQSATLTALTLWADVPFPGEWQGLHTTNLVLSIAFGLAAFWALCWGAGKAVGALAIAAFFGGTLGIASVTLVERFTEPGSGTRFANAIAKQSALVNGAGWVSVWMLALVLVMVGVASVASLIPMACEPDKVAQRKPRTPSLAEKTRWKAAKKERARREMLVRVRRVVGRARSLLWSAVAVGLAAAALMARTFISQGWSPSNLVADTWGPVIVLPIAAGVVTLAALWPLGNWVLRLAIPTLAVVAIVAANRQTTLTFLGVSIRPASLIDVSLGLAVLIPAGLIFRSIIGGLRHGENRRKTGLLWDVASFWPRYFHPLGPPAYGPNAVQELKKEVKGRSLTLSAHSQGSVVATVALSQMQPDDRRGLLQVITYGSPIGLIYSGLFGQSGLDRLVKETGNIPGLRWRNLWRRTDYLGGLRLPLPGDSNFEADGVGHSGYECTRQFRQVKIGLDPDSPLSDLQCGRFVPSVFEPDPS